ncbi:MAG: DUF2784 domain-containing protein [Fidelibacterota bacterium]
MDYRIAADIVVVLHFTFILFVIGGGFLAVRWPKIIWLHIPCAIWGALIEFAGWYCPLTPLENYFRRSAGDAGLTGGFIEEYLLPVIYPAGMSRTVQIVLGVIVIVINVSVYGYLLFRRFYNKN